MPTPTMGKVPTQPTSAPTSRRRRPLFLLLASALLVLAAAIGTSVALASRPLDRQASDQPTVAANDQTALGQTANDQTRLDQSPSLPPETPAKDEPTQDPASGAPADTAPVLADGRHDAYISKVDGDKIVVDVVQVFHDDAAVKAAIEDGKSRDEAKYLVTHVRNQNLRLRTLPLADDVRIQLRDACGDPGDNREALLTKLAGNARQGSYYYTLTVSDGQVDRIQERLAINAC